MSSKKFYMGFGMKETPPFHKSTQQNIIYMHYKARILIHSKTVKATPIYLVGLRIRRLKLWGNGKKIKVLCDLPFNIIFIFIIFAAGRIDTVFYFYFYCLNWQTYVPLLVEMQGELFKTRSQFSNKYTSMAASYIFYFYFFPAYHF